MESDTVPSPGADLETDLDVEMWYIGEHRHPVDHPSECGLTMIVDSENPPLVIRSTTGHRIRQNHRLMEIENDIEVKEESVATVARQFRHLSGRAVKMADEDEVRPYPESLHGEKIPQGAVDDIEERLEERYG